MAVFNGAISTPAPPAALVVDHVWPLDSASATARLKWTHSPDPVYCYNVYRRNPDTTRTWLGATPNNAYFVPELRRSGSEAFAPLEVETVGLDFGVSTAAATNVFWPATLVSTGAVWKYSDTGLNLGTAWRALAYNDAAWPSGPAMLGYGDANGMAPRTTNSFGPSDTNKYITTYYRRAFVAEEPSTYSSLGLNVQRDDGAVVYLNGTEVFRSNMPAGAVDYLTPASAAVSGGDETTFYYAALNSSALRAGTNVLAVEIHQNAANSSDIAFDLSLVAQINAAPAVSVTAPADGTVLTTNRVVITAAASDLDGTVAIVDFFANGSLIGRRSVAPYTVTLSDLPIGFHLLTARAVDNAGRSATSAPVSVTVPGAGVAEAAFVPAGAVWRYFDGTNDLGEAWRSSTFNDSGWKSGQAELGFGDSGDNRPETTVVANNLQWTTYFRRTFYVPSALMVCRLNARLIRDDGAVVYLNGAEVWRNNMPAGLITNATPASSVIGGADEYTWLTNTLPRSALRDGTNLLAVEIHQQNLGSGDISFNFELTGPVIVPVEPALEPALEGANLVLRWAADPGLFSVFMATNVAQPVWAPVTAAPVLAPGGWTLTLPAPAQGSRFYRLRTP